MPRESNSSGKKRKEGKTERGTKRVCKLVSKSPEDEIQDLPYVDHIGEREKLGRNAVSVPVDYSLHHFYRVSRKISAMAILNGYALDAFLGHKGVKFWSFLEIYERVIRIQRPFSSRLLLC